MKQLKRQAQTQAPEQSNEVTEAKPKGLEAFLLWIIRLGTAAALFTPLVLHGKYYFPFVGPKGLYLMAFCQIVFFAWLFLAIHHKKYRPNINRVFTAFVCLLGILILSSIFGVDFSRSFWSKFERMTGLLMWLHLFGWVLAISSSFRKLSDWRGVLWTSVGIGSLTGFMSLISEVGVVVYVRGGSALGNSSFLGTYLLFHVFFALYLFFREKNLYLKISAAIAAVLCALAIYFSGARAATLGVAGGLGLIALLYLSFKPKIKAIRITGRIVLVISVVLTLFLIVLLFVPDSFVSNKFIELTTASRAVNWQMAWKGFSERPMLGWGPENYTVFFTKFFDPCLFTEKCGGEVWFDRTHNIVLDTLITTGIFGLLAYIGFFVVMIYTLAKKYFQQKTIGFWTFAIFTALLVAYITQNLTVFDMPASLMLFAITIGFIASFAGQKQPEMSGEKSVKPWVAILLGIVFLATFFEFVIQPSRTDSLVISAVVVHDAGARLERYKRAFEASSMGKYQIRDFFAQNSENVIRESLDTVPTEVHIKELDFIVEELQKTRKESPLDFRAALKLAQVYNLYALLDASKLVLAEKYGQEALELSPTNQQAYWALAQTKLYQSDYDTALQLTQAAVDLEPEWLNSYKIVIQAAERADRPDIIKEIIQKALAVNPDWADQFDDISADEETSE